MNRINSLLIQKPEKTRIRKASADSIVMMPVSEVRPYEKNPRKNAGAVQYVKASIEKFGFRQPIIIDKNRVIVCGHTRLLAAKSLGMAEVPCIFADDLTDEQVKAYRLADNKVAEFAEWDSDLLNIELGDMADLDIDMTQFGFDPFEEEQPEIIEDEIPEEVEPVAKLGDIFQLGEHRLMCGDSTSVEDVAKLMNGELADLWLTDPPYNVDYEGGTAEKLTIKNDSMKDEAFNNFLVDAFKAATDVLKEGASFYIWYADVETFNFSSALRTVGLQLRQVLIWVKNAMILGRKDYHFKHEPCLYGWKDGAAHNWYADRKQTTVMEFDKPLRNTEHPTMKPVGLFGYLMQNSSKEGDIVMDTFSGSGTTIVACEQLHRKARCMELDPHYCDVIIARWEKFTGGKAELVQEGKTT